MDGNTSTSRLARVGRVERERAQALGDRIRELRKAQRLTQEKLGELCGMHRTYIGQIERGEVSAGFLKLVAIADALGADLDTLVYGQRRQAS